MQLGRSGERIIESGICPGCSGGARSRTNLRHIIAVQDHCSLRSQLQERDAFFRLAARDVDGFGRAHRNIFVQGRGADECGERQQLVFRQAGGYGIDVLVFVRDIATQTANCVFDPVVRLGDANDDSFFSAVL